MNSRLICGPTRYIRKQSDQDCLLPNSSKFLPWLKDFPRFTASSESESSHSKYSCCLCWKTVTQAIGSKSLLGEKGERLTGHTYDSIAGNCLKRTCNHPILQRISAEFSKEAVPPWKYCSRLLWKVPWALPGDNRWVSHT